jgi:hypothetical protein
MYGDALPSSTSVEPVRPARSSASGRLTSTSPALQPDPAGIGQDSEGESRLHSSIPDDVGRRTLGDALALVAVTQAWISVCGITTQRHLRV